MKKFVVVVMVWVMFLLSIGSSIAKSEIEFQIKYDSKTKETYTLKKKIQESYRELVSGLHQESYIFMVLHNLDAFEYEENISAIWKDNQLVIQEGDGRGDEITGILSANSVCVPKVQPRSFFSEMFD